jgi:hypothetical protein
VADAAADVAPPEAGPWQRALLVPQPALNVLWIVAMTVQWVTPRYWPVLVFAAFPLGSLWLAARTPPPRPFAPMLGAFLELAWTVITLLVVTLVIMVQRGMG